MSAYTKEHFTDFTLECLDGKLFFYRIHMSQNSVMLAALLNFKESETRIMKVEFNINVMDVVLRYLDPFCKNHEIPKEFLNDVVSAADYYQMDDLKNKCSDLMLELMEPELLECAEHYDLPCYKALAYALFDNNKLTFFSEKTANILALNIKICPQSNEYKIAKIFSLLELIAAHNLRVSETLLEILPYNILNAEHFQRMALIFPDIYPWCFEKVVNKLKLFEEKYKNYSRLHFASSLPSAPILKPVPKLFL